MTQEFLVRHWKSQEHGRPWWIQHAYIYIGYLLKYLNKYVFTPNVPTYVKYDLFKKFKYGKG